MLLNNFVMAAWCIEKGCAASRLIIINCIKTLGGSYLNSCIVLEVRTRKIFKEINIWIFPFISIFEHSANVRG